MIFAQFITEEQLTKMLKEGIISESQCDIAPEHQEEVESHMRNFESNGPTTQSGSASSGSASSGWVTSPSAMGTHKAQGNGGKLKRKAEEPVLPPARDPADEIKQATRKWNEGLYNKARASLATQSKKKTAIQG